MANSATFVAHIDESGDEGFRIGGGSSRWFVLAAVVLRRSEELAQVKLIDEVRERLNRDRKPGYHIPAKKPLHFRDLKHEQRKFTAHRIAQAEIRTVCVLIHKPDLTSPENFQGESRLYNYAVRLLVERISWYCRDHRRKDDTGDGSVNLVFSNRESLDYDALREYLGYLEANRAALEYRAAPGLILPEQVETFSPGQRMGLQVADAVASSYYFAVEPSPYGLPEDGYARLLLPRGYRQGTQVWGYGIKIMPREAEERRRSGEILAGWEL